MRTNDGGREKSEGNGSQNRADTPKQRKIKEKKVMGGEEQEECEVRVELGVRGGDLVT